jgi:bile acid:Na+ symporter, BASS family
VLIGVLFPTIVHSMDTVYGSRGMMAILILVLLSMVTGWLLGGPEPEDRRVLGIGTTLRNVGLCALIASTNFPRTPVVAAVLTYFVFQFVVTTLFGAYFGRRAREAAA